MIVQAMQAASSYFTRSSSKSRKYFRILLSETLQYNPSATLDWAGDWTLDTGHWATRAWHLVSCVMLYLISQGQTLSLTIPVWVVIQYLTWPYLAAVWRRHLSLSPSLLASRSRSLVFSTSHCTVSSLPYWKSPSHLEMRENWDNSYFILNYKK